MVKYFGILLKVTGEGQWTEVARAEGQSPHLARSAVAEKANFGWGGHNRSRRDQQALADGHTVQAPLGTYQTAVVRSIVG